MSPPRAQTHSGAWFPDDVTGPSEQHRCAGRTPPKTVTEQASYEPKGQSISCFPRPGSGGPAHTHPCFSRPLRRNSPQLSCAQ